MKEFVCHLSGHSNTYNKKKIKMTNDFSMFYAHAHRLGVSASSQRATDQNHKPNQCSTLVKWLTNDIFFSFFSFFFEFRANKRSDSRNYRFIGNPSWQIIIGFNCRLEMQFISGKRYEASVRWRYASHHTHCRFPLVQRSIFHRFRILMVCSTTAFNSFSAQ